MYLDDYTTAPKFEKQGNSYKYTGKDSVEKDFFSKYSILEFLQAYPDSERFRTLNVFIVVTYDKALMEAMVNTFPRKYLEYHDITDKKVEYLESYPNDYGITSPVANLGFPVSLKNLDYINAPKAWDYTFGDNGVLIGISDTGLFQNDPEFQYKTTYIPGFVNSSDPHGTGVTAIAAAQGNNGNGITGVCSNCGIVEARSEFGGSSEYLMNYPDFNRLLLLAKAGVKVINMSWRWPGGVEYGHQWVIDEVHDCYNVVLVAASGNENPNNPNYFAYPASYNHVISVSGVNHKNEDFDDEIVVSNGVNVSRFVADQIAPSVVVNPDGSLTSYPLLTINSAVDICAPAFNYFRYTQYVLGLTPYYLEGGATSAAAPHVTGTVGLMYSVNEYLDNDEVEDIIQLTAKNLEIIHGNEPFVGRIGAGKLETGDAVEFVYEMKEANGNALIDGQDFYRFDFNLAHINNKLTISNQIFRDKCTADFSAKKIIEVLPGSDFKPNADGFVDLKIDSNINPFPEFNVPEDCDNYDGGRKGVFEPGNNTDTYTTKLYPNPNNGSFEITLPGTITGDVNIEVVDIYGKIVYRSVTKEPTFAVDIPNLATGVYLVRLTGGSINESIKFIKE